MLNFFIIFVCCEYQRLAEGLDAEVKRWSSGKQGNLRALLSTLQYVCFLYNTFSIGLVIYQILEFYLSMYSFQILGADSGWQPVPLTEVITTAAVRKAYRKATLCVHPDKLQQRGASIQQKYICEKVFDLLKVCHDHPCVYYFYLVVFDYILSMWVFL